MAKYDSRRKLKRNSALFDYKVQNPDDSWEEVGVMFGVSKQRACEIYQNERQRREKLNPVPVVK